MIKCINCNNYIEDDSDFCYFCGHLLNENSNMDIKNPTNESSSASFSHSNHEEFTLQETDYDYTLHGLHPLYEVKGNLGRRLYVYEHKCVLKVDVTIGSLLAQNSTDGEKTLYYKDIIGIQCKKEGLLTGYLQFETASSKGNSNSSNFLDENTFTFNYYEDVYEAYKYIISRLDNIKSNFSRVD